MGQPSRKEVAPAVESVSAEPSERWSAPAPLSRRGWVVIGAIALLVNLPLIHYFLFRAEPEAPVSVPYRDDFSDPATVAKNYWSSGGYWRVVNGELLSPGVKNNPLWLKARLPKDAAVEFDVRSESPEGDIKAEIFGDGSDHASGYVLIHGGWNNSLSVIARLDEHGRPFEQLKADRRGPKMRTRVEARPFPVERGRTYHWRIERRGSLLRWFIDNQIFMEFDDPFPLAGKGHDRFGFSSWEAQLFFDNLKVEAL